MQLTRDLIPCTIVLLFSILASFGTSACVPDVPQKLLWDPAVLQHPAIAVAFQAVEEGLNELFVNITRDSLSFAIVHASSPEKVYSYNHGTLKVNETSLDPAENTVTSDSIFRLNSISKSFAVFSALVVENICKNQADQFPEFTIDTPVRNILPQFGLPEKDWNNGGRDITLHMLASHSSGLTREGYSTNFNLVTGVGKATAESIGADWAGATPEGVLEVVKKVNLMFPPGQRPGYSNAGMSVLATAIVSYYNNSTASDVTWSQLAMNEILAPLNMTHSFFGAIPDSLLPYIGVPGGPNWADLIVGLGYDPAAGMWGSANDLTKYLYNIWLRPDPLPLITVPQRRRSLQPNLALPDGKQLVGAGWEIDLFNLPTSNATTAVNKTYASYGKGGDGGGWHSWIDVIPNLGYGLVLLTQMSGLDNYTTLFPNALKEAAHEILMPAFAEAVAARMEQRFAGTYGNAQDSSIISEQLNTTNTANATSYAKVEVAEQILYIRELVINGTSALRAIDALSWTADEQIPYYSTPKGVALTPAEGAGENAQFGPGAQVWRMFGPGEETCDWFDFDGYEDQNGWPLGKVVFVERDDGGVELRYPPFDVVLSRV